MDKELQKANDMLSALQAQRDQALNAVVMAQAEMAALRREIAALIKEKAADPVVNGTKGVDSNVHPGVAV